MHLFFSYPHTFASTETPALKWSAHYTCPGMKQRRHQLSVFPVSRAVLTKERLWFHIFIYLCLLSLYLDVSWLQSSSLSSLHPFLTASICSLLCCVLCFPHLSILKTFMPLCWDLAALCVIEPCLIYRVSFLVPPQPFLPLHVLLIQALQSVLQISATMRLHRSPKLKLWKTLLPSRLGSSYLQN